MIDRRRVVAALGSTAIAAVAMPARLRATEALTPVRIASVKFGSLSWVLDTIKANGLDQRFGIALEIIDVPSNQAGPVALLSDGADVIVSDWTWAMRQRALGEKLYFSPYSTALGGVVVPNDSPVKSIADLEGKSLGIAGSNIDKSWILLRAYAQMKTGRDIQKTANVSFGAAPLIAEELRNGRIDAALNFWTYVAKLTGSGFRSVISVAEMVGELGISPLPPLVGLIWKDAYGTANPKSVEAVIKAVHAANEILAKDDAAWDRIRTLVKPANDGEFASLKQAFRAGIPKPWSDEQLKSTEALMQILVSSGDSELMGEGTKFDPELFRHAAI